MHSLRFTAETSLRFTAETSSTGVLERDFTLGEITGVLWSPAAGSEHPALVLMGHGGGLDKKAPGLRGRALHCVTAHGFTVAAIDAPGHGARPRSTEDERIRTDLHQALAAGIDDSFLIRQLRPAPAVRT